jgi:hypothetical protein
MKVKTNLKKKKSSSSTKSDSSPSVKREKPSYNVEEISNGWIVTKSWTNKDGMYQSEKIYHADNPIDKAELEDKGE